MNLSSITLILSLLVFIHTQFINTTDFWKSQIQSEAINFQSFAGYEEINWYRNRNQSGMYYQLFGSKGSDLKNVNQTIPLIIWLEGGPGQSSLFGAYKQVGPVHIIDQKTIQIRNNSWYELAHLLFVDQPLNVGFSYDQNSGSKNQTSSVAQASEHLLNFLYNFYRTWPKLTSSPIYILGESDGGKFALRLAKLLLANSSMNINPKGVIISSGLIDPPNQLNYYDSLLYSSGIVSNRFRDILSSLQTKAAVNIYKNNLANASEDFSFVARNQNISKQYWGGMSLFNIRSYQQDDKSMEKYLQQFKKELGANQDINFIAQNQNVFDSFKDDLMKSYVKDLLSIISNLNVLIVNGQNDYLVNSAGVQNYLNALGWSRINSWKNVKKQKWIISNQVKGWAKTFSNLWFVLVNAAGHQIPKDQPKSSFNLLQNFIANNKNWNQ